MIESISMPMQTVQTEQPAQTRGKSGENTFSQLFKQSLESLNKAQIKSDQLTNALATGKDVELHDVMITAQKASILLDAAIEVRNKAVEAYQEIMRMQV